MLYVIGIGPGKPEYMTEEAARALAACELIVGYPLYLELVKKQFPGKEYYATPMTREIGRCRYALEQARERRVALVCSGDAGVYGMAGPVLELAPEYPETGIRVISGVTAALGGAALLGAPLTHDFAVISLSDRLTPMEEICRKLKNAAESGFVIALYNPSSKKRQGYLRMACEILLTCLAPSTVCGYVRNVGRDATESKILPLEELKNFEADMFTTVFVGNSRTREIAGRMVTPRGYGEKILRRDPAAGTEKTGMPGSASETAETENAGDAALSAGTEDADFSGAVLVAAGTTEGRELCEYFARRGQKVCAFVATEYGEEMLPESPYILAERGRKNADEMLAFIRSHGIRTCYDAMHPYATLAHKNMKEACERSGCTYVRVLREQEKESARDGEKPKNEAEQCGAGLHEGVKAGIVRVSSIREAAEYLKKQDGNILLATGSRELEPFTEIENFEKRIWARVLPSVESLDACRKAGLPGKQVIAMHGPFSKEMNELILREHEIRWLVTKESGRAGGFSEKLAAAESAGAHVVVVERPREEAGVTLKDIMI